MFKLKTPFIVLAVLLLSGCVSLSSNPHPGKIEQVGVLLVKNCQNSSDCDPYSLLEPDMHTRRATLSGNIDASLKGRLIAVLGTQSADGSGSIYVEQNRSITQFDYLPFIKKAVADYSRQDYQCLSLWDQSYRWRLDDRQPVLIATLTNPLKEKPGQVQLEYDGVSKALLSAQVFPGDTNPCRMK